MVGLVMICALEGRKEHQVAVFTPPPPDPCAEDNMTGFVTGYRLGKRFDLVRPIAVNPLPAKFTQKGLQICPKHSKDNNPTTDKDRMVQ